MRDDDRDELDDLDAPVPMEEADDGDEPIPGERAAPELTPHGDRLRRNGSGVSPAEEAFVRGGEDVASLPLLTFYDRLRGRIVGVLERRGGKVGRSAADALLLVPDVFMLLVRLALDPEVPPSTRGLIGGALAYFVLPFDLLPEGLIGGVGYLDDLVLAAAVLTQALGPELEPRARRYWSGRQELREVLLDVVGAAQSLLGDRLFGRLERLLSRRGVALPRHPEPARGERAYEGFEGDAGSELS
ncbi:MAG TPA: YkvA family protein [Thermoanaerobaculia bacterium]|nr:YkvA family protein [Thermoanaerobaculia bacterium]